MAVTDILKRDPVASARKANEAAVRGLANAHAKRSAAMADLDAAERAQTVAATADGDAADGVLESATRRLRDARDLVDAFDTRVIPAAEAAVTASEAQMVDAERQAQHTAATAKVAVARARVAKEYPDIQRRYTELLTLITDADDAVRAVNADLPAGAAPLDTVEGPIRDWPEVPRRILSDIVKPVWYHQSGDRVIDQSKVMDGKYRGGRGSDIMVRTDHCSQHPMRVVVSIPERWRVTGARMAATPLPPLRVEEPADRPAVTEYLQPENPGKGAAA